MTNQYVLGYKAGLNAAIDKIAVEFSISTDEEKHKLWPLVKNIAALPVPEVQATAWTELVEAAVLAEREACAKVCDDIERAKWESVRDIGIKCGRIAFAGPVHCAAAIRARTK